jgi:hypothetical protein
MIVLLQGERIPAAQARPGRVDGDGSQRPVQVRLPEGSVIDPLALDVSQQPAQLQLVACCEQRNGVRGTGMGTGELDRRVDSLDGLRPRREIPAGDDVQARYLWLHEKHHIATPGGSRTRDARR